ncbi:hypothetical protein Dimus_037394 [Dionaea muscipula]
MHIMFCSKGILLSSFGMDDEGNWFHTTVSNTNFFSAVPWEQTCPGFTSDQFDRIPPFPAGDRVAVAAGSSKSHSLAEKRRRDRINAQLTSLRKLIPKSEKMDKASLLATTVDHIKDLKLKTIEINKFLSVPVDSDEVTVEPYAGQEADSNEVTGNKNILFNVTFCCEDRRELFQELISALKDLKLSIVGGDIACLGGRIRTNLALGKEEDGEEDHVCTTILKQSLKAVLGRIISSAAPNFRVTSRRQRFFFASHSRQQESQQH